MNESSAPAGVPESIYVSHQEFCDGLPAGRLRLIVNPQRAQKYIRHRLFVIGIALPLAGVGTALSLAGHPWAGLPMVAASVLLHRLVKAHAPKILLHLATKDAKTYQEAIDYEIMEVRLAS